MRTCIFEKLMFRLMKRKPEAFEGIRCETLYTPDSTEFPHIDYLYEFMQKLEQNHGIIVITEFWDDGYTLMKRGCDNIEIGDIMRGVYYALSNSEYDTYEEAENSLPF